MTSAVGPHHKDRALLPSRGMQVMLEDMPGGPWLTSIDGMADDGGVILLSPPRLGGKPVRLPLGRRLRISYALSDVPCEIDADLVAGPGTDGAVSYTARAVGAPRRMQRRSAVRVPINLMARASARTPGDGSPADDIGAVTENLSGGGVLMRAAEPFAPGTVLALRLECGGSVGTLALDGRVVRCDPLEPGDHPWRVAIAFVDPPVATQDCLVRFLFERQRELRRRESGLA
jgi:c-di-GMP-binding flagellar brake protein YcgR